MKIESKGHIYPCLPPFLDNRKLHESEQIVIGLKVVPMPEQDMYQREVMMIRNEYAIDKAQELIEEKTRALVASKVAYIKGLEIGGINDDGRDLSFTEFYENAPPELVNWVVRAVMKTTELSHADRKNWLPVSVSG